MKKCEYLLSGSHKKNQLIGWLAKKRGGQMLFTKNHTILKDSLLSMAMNFDCVDPRNGVATIDLSFYTLSIKA